MGKDNILKPVSLLLIITAIVAVINFIYNIIMSRMLGVADFGDLRALFSMIMLLSIPLTAIQTMMAKFTAQYYKTDLGKLKSLSIHTAILMLVIGFICMVIFGSLRYFLANYLKVSSANLIVLLGPLMLLTLIQPIILGIFQGLERFLLLGTGIFVGTILKLLLGVFFVSLGLATLGALYGLIGSGVLVILVFGLVPIFLFGKDIGPKTSYNRHEVYTYSGYALGVLICFSIISQIDILIVKHKFLPLDAGLYACAAIIGKGFLFLPVPVVTVLFPKVVENNRTGRSSLPILTQSLFISLSLCIIGVAICFFFPQYLVKIFGNKYTQAIPLVKIFGLATCPLALFYVLMNYFLSEYRLKFFYYCLVACILAVAVLFTMPKTLNHFLLVLGWFGLLIFILPLVYIYLTQRQNA